MEALDFDLKLITPAFLAGAMEIEAKTPLRDQGRIPRHRLIGPDGDGLRIPSLRGVLRFWFRAMEGLGDTALLGLRESAVFGGPECGQGLRLVPLGQSDWKAEEIRAGAGGAEAYLGYGPLQFVTGQGVSSHHKLGFRDTIPAGAKFSFRAIGRESQLRDLRRCLILLHLFGGLGARSRRGWGSVAVVAECIPARQGEETFASWVARCLAIVWPEGGDRPSQRPKEPRYSAFWKDTSIRYFNAVPGKGGGGGALSIYGAVFAQFFDAFRGTRLYNRNQPARSPVIAAADHELEREALKTGNLVAAPRRLAFGFPYNVRFSNHSTLTFRARSGAGHAAEVTRRSSPLFLKVIEEAPGQYAGMGLFLKSQFFSSSKTMIEAKETAGRVAPPDFSAVEAFLRQQPWQTLPLP
jgi:CRISPR-associated protein Cmr1